MDSGHDYCTNIYGRPDVPEGTGLNQGHIDWLKDKLDLLDEENNDKDNSNYHKIIFLHHPYINAYTSNHNFFFLMGKCCACWLSKIITSILIFH